MMQAIPTIVLDACVLYPAQVRDLLLPGGVEILTICKYSCRGDRSLAVLYLLEWKARLKK